MYGLRQRPLAPRRLLSVALSSAALAALLALWAFSPRTSAAHPAIAQDNVTLTFTVTVAAGTPPDDVVFWVCPDAQNDGTGCDEMNAQPDGTYVYQLTTTTGTTYQHITVQWSHGRLPTDQGPIPAPPVHIISDYHPVAVTASSPRSYTSKVEAAVFTATPTPPSTTQTPTSTPATDPAGTGSSDNSTIVTGLQIIIVVGLFLLIILLIILIWQRLGMRRKYR